MDLEIIKIILYVLAGVVIFKGLKKLMSKPKKCTVCSIDTKDKYIDEKNNSISLCRNHLVERWKKDVILSTHDTVVIEPDFIKYPYAYFYATLDELSEFEGFGKEGPKNLTSILDLMQGKVCKECGSEASIIYFKKEDNCDFPFFKEIKILPSYLCKNCVVKKIEPLLMNSSTDFSEGVYAPRNNRGIYYTWEC